MTKTEIFEKIQAIVSKERGADFLVSLDTSINDNLVEDSVEMMEFILTLEDEFSVSLPDEAIDHFRTLGDIVDYISHEKN